MTYKRESIREDFAPKVTQYAKNKPVACLTSLRRNRIRGTCLSGDCCFVFFFSSRRRHTRFDCDWSSDVCSSDSSIQSMSLSRDHPRRQGHRLDRSGGRLRQDPCGPRLAPAARNHEASRSAVRPGAVRAHRSEEHTSELQSQSNLVCRLLLEKKKS